VSVVCCKVEVSETGWSLVQMSPTECGVSKKCVIVKPRKMRRPRPQRGCRAIGKKKLQCRREHFKLIVNLKPYDNSSWIVPNHVYIIICICQQMHINCKIVKLQIIFISELSYMFQR
jgi:hypothetical protein